MRLMRRTLLALACGAALVSSAPGVVISTGDGSGNTNSPGSNTGWANVGRVSSASGVYLGNRWVITANHVSTAPLRLSDGRTFAVSVGSDVRLRNTAGGFGNPDLKMFRLAEDPGLASPEIAGAVPGIGAQVMMIGAGLDRGRPILGWDAAWNPVAFTSARNVGFSLLSEGHMRWGMNQVGTSTLFGSNQTFSFNTTFHRSGVPFEAQVAVGDSGGGVFHKSGDAWQLVGIMLNTQSLSGQPSSTVVFGQSAGIAALPFYGAQIMELINRAEPLWQNQANHFDVDASGRAEPRDVLILVNKLLSEGPHDLTGAPGAGDQFLDVNGDYEFSMADAQRVVAALVARVANPAAASTAGSGFVPEPTSGLLFVVGLASAAILAACGRFARGRKRQ